MGLLLRPTGHCSQIPTLVLNPKKQEVRLCCGPGSATGGRATWGESPHFSDCTGFDEIIRVNALCKVPITRQEGNTLLPSILLSKLGSPLPGSLTCSLGSPPFQCLPITGDLLSPTLSTDFSPLWRHPSASFLPEKALLGLLMEFSCSPGPPCTVFPLLFLPTSPGI